MALKRDYRYRPYDSDVIGAVKRMINQSKILVYGDPRLRRRAQEVEDPSMCDALVKRMSHLLRDHHGAGLAATQIGEDKRVVIWLEEGQTRTLINPVLTLGDEEEIGFEGCLSVPGMAGLVRRAVSIRAEGFNLKGGPIKFDASGMLARVIQHEVDHLDGVLFIDRVEPGSLRPMPANEVLGI